MPNTIPNHKLIRVAADAGCNPSSVRDYCQGKLKRKSLIDKIDAALEKNGCGEHHTTQPRSLAIDSNPGSKA